MAMRGRTLYCLMVLCLIVSGALTSSADAEPQTKIPAKIALLPVKAPPTANRAVGLVELKTSNKNDVTPELQSIIHDSLSSYLQKSGLFLHVVSIKAEDLPSSASVAEISQAGRDAGADLVLICTLLDFDGKIDYGFKTLLKEHMTIEFVIYETTTNKRLWHGRESIDQEKKVLLSSWDEEKTVKNYLSMAADQTLTALLSAAVSRVGIDMASYKPPVLEKLSAAAAADFVSDVDRVPRSAKEEKANAYAVVIGIENYRDLPAAEFTARDARTMKEYLIRVMGFPQENIVTLLNERATRGDMEGYVGTWLKKSTSRNSQIIVYFAGHGAPNPVTGEPYLIPYDGNPAFLEASAVPLKRLYQMLSELDVKDVLLIMDSCFSGGGGRSVMAKGGRPIAVSVENPMLASKNIVVLSASKGTEISSSYPEKRHGLFTYFLLKGLQGEADITGDRTINIEKLYNYVTPQVKKIARESNREQTPTITPDLEMLGGRARTPLATLH